MIFFAHHSFPRATCCQTTKYLFNCSSRTLFLSFLFTYIHFFHLSYLGGPKFPFGVPTSRAQWQTCCRTINTFFLVHHVHYFNLSFPQIYILFSFTILGPLNFLSWGHLHFRLGPTISEPSGRFIFSFFLFTYTFFSSFLSWGPLNFLSWGPLNFRLGSQNLGPAPVAYFLSN